jgi:23S rRNA (guanosine2251-2'-O)-methyltransferase
MNRKLKNEELGRISYEEFKNAGKIPAVVLLDNVRSLHNVGSVFRTCDAFLVETLYLCGYTGTPPNKEINKTALGSVESVNWKHEKDIVVLVKKLQKEGYLVYSIEQVEKSVFLHDFKVKSPEKYALVFGNEVNGVSQEVIDISDGVIEISQGGTKHSLNIAVSAGIVLWEFYKKFKK